MPAADVEPLDARLWFAGFEIAATEARYEPASGKVEVDLDITNTQRAAADATTLFINDASALVRDGHRTTLFCACPRLPPGTSGRATATASVGEGFALDGAVLEFGAANQHQAMLPLDGSPATSERPVSQPMTGLVDDGQVATFTVEQVEVVPAACYGLADRLQFVAGPKDRIALVVVGSVVSRGRLRVGADAARPTTPSPRRASSSRAAEPSASSRSSATCCTPARSYSSPSRRGAGSSTAGTTRMWCSRATVISRSTLAEAIEGGEITSTTASACRIPATIEARHGSLPRMSSVSTHVSCPRASRASTSRETKAASCRE